MLILAPLSLAALWPSRPTTDPPPSTAFFREHPSSITQLSYWAQAVPARRSLNSSPGHMIANGHHSSIRVGQFQVCVSDFFHLLNFGVCYREKNEKKIYIFFGTLLTLASSHTWRVNKFTSKFFCIPALKFQIPFWQLVPGFRPPLLSRTTDWNRNITHIQWLKHEITNSL